MFEVVTLTLKLPAEPYPGNDNLVQRQEKLEALLNDGFEIKSSCTFKVESDKFLYMSIIHTLVRKKKEQGGRILASS